MHAVKYSMISISFTLAIDQYFLDLSDFHFQFCVASKRKTAFDPKLKTKVGLAALNNQKFLKKSLKIATYLST